MVSLDAIDSPSLPRVPANVRPSTGWKVKRERGCQCGGDEPEEAREGSGPISSHARRLADRRPRGQTECDYGAMVRFAFDADGAAMPLNDSLGCAETETCTLEPFGREERLEGSALNIRRHAGSGIGDLAEGVTFG